MLSVLALFIFAGILVGGVKTAYDNENRVMTFIAGIAAAVVLAAALILMFLTMQAQ